MGTVATETAHSVGLQVRGIRYVVRAVGALQTLWDSVFFFSVPLRSLVSLTCLDHIIPFGFRISFSGGQR